MFLESRVVLIPIGSLIAGVIAGHLLRVQAGIDLLGSWAQQSFGAGSGFQESFVTSSILFCAGPMTLLGCLEDGLARKTRLLGVKSILDGVSSVFIAATVGLGVFLSAGTVLIVQGALTLGAKQLKRIASRPAVLAEMSSVGGLILCLIGLDLLDIVSLPTADYLPGLLIAGTIANYVSRRETEEPPGEA